MPSPVAVALEPLRVRSGVALSPPRVADRALKRGSDDVIGAYLRASPVIA